MLAILLISIAGALFGLSITNYERSTPEVRHLLDAAAVVACILVLWTLGNARGSTFIWSAVTGIFACAITSLVIRRFRKPQTKNAS